MKDENAQVPMFEKARQAAATAKAPTRATFLMAGAVGKTPLCPMRAVGCV
jgi:hypothetical protein